MNTPVLLITFNRPFHTRQVLSRIREVRPERLFIFQDGARDSNQEDGRKITEVRDVIDEMIDWPCRVEKYYSEVNLGCGPGPAAAITWYFENVDKGIILEDDAVPHTDFFSYASELLDRYESDDKVKAIGSMKVAQEAKVGDGSYYFSMMNRNLCAWATWKRSWNAFNISLSEVSRHRLNSALKKYNCGVLERSYWLDRLDEVHDNCCNGKSWDMQFFMSIWLSGGKGIIPNVNLSSNIGTTGEATHVFSAGNIIDSLPTSSIMPLVHPSDSNISSDTDTKFHFLYFEPTKANWGTAKKLYYIINKQIKKLVGHTGPWIKRK